MRINHNIPALRALHQLTMNNSKLDKSLERLSSGLRINHASDDAAGLAITQKMDTQIRGLGQANRNTMDGISLIQTAEGAMNEVHAMLQRMRELAVQASNGTYDEDDRDAIQKEVKQLNDEIERISLQTEFNEKKLLNGDIDYKAFANPSDLDVVGMSDTVKAGDYKLKVDVKAVKASITGTAHTPDVITPAEAGDIYINGEKVTINAGDTPEQVFTKLDAAAQIVGANILAYDGATSVAYQAGVPNLNLKIEMKEFGSEPPLTITPATSALRDKLGLGTGATSDVGKDTTISIYDTSDFSDTATFTSTGKAVTIRDINGFEMTLDVNIGGNDVVISVIDAGALTLQIGANEGQSMDVRIPDLSPKALGIDTINLGTKEGAQLALAKISDAVNQVSKIRSRLGAYQNRLEHTANNLSVASESLTGAMSRILDADMAYEMAQYTQRNVIAQAGTSMLAQANQRPQSVLQLLQN